MVTIRTSHNSDYRLACERCKQRPIVTNVVGNWRLKMENKWFSVDEKLPAYNDLYLVIVNGYPLVKGWDGIGWREHQMVTPLYEGDISHWTFIPKPPPTIAQPSLSGSEQSSSPKSDKSDF